MKRSASITNLDLPCRLGRQHLVATLEFAGFVRAAARPFANLRLGSYATLFHAFNFKVKGFANGPFWFFCCVSHIVSPSSL